MRIFYIPSGKYQGEHPIYEGIKEFQKEIPDTEYKQWGRETDPYDIKAGDYVESYDGYISKLLAKRQLINKKSGQITYIFRMCNGSFMTYQRKNGTHHWQKWYAQFTTNDLDSASTYRRRDVGEAFTAKKMKFGRLVAMSVEPYRAYVQAGFPYEPRLGLLKNKIRDLMMDEGVINEVNRQLTPYVDKLREDPEFSDESMIGYVKEFMANVRKGSQAHLNSIVPLLTLLGKLPGSLEAGKAKNVNEIEEANWNQPPPSGFGEDTEKKVAND